jgi:hypothetical protein
VSKQERIEKDRERVGARVFCGWCDDDLAKNQPTNRPPGYLYVVDEEQYRAARTHTRVRSYVPPKEDGVELGFGAIVHCPVDVGVPHRGGQQHVIGAVPGRTRIRPHGALPSVLVRWRRQKVALPGHGAGAGAGTVFVQCSGAEEEWSSRWIADNGLLSPFSPKTKIRSRKGLSQLPRGDFFRRWWAPMRTKPASKQASQQSTAPRFTIGEVLPLLLLLWVMMIK